MSDVLMKCGHNATGTHKGKPCCASCAFLADGWNEIETNVPDLTGRKARCSMCEGTRESEISLPFFEHRKNQSLDLYYCGCRGWD